MPLLVQALFQLASESSIVFNDKNPHVSTPPVFPPYLKNA
jgi:hypothetical protein